MEEAKMEKFKEIVIKLANTAPNKPLSESENSVILDRLNQFISVHHSPDHPPYAWMIERALQELNEEGGSSVESISNFIRKEYDDLPWFHFTLLNHHLEELCKCGNIVPTNGHHYLLAGADSTLNSGKKCRRKQKRRKRDWDWQVKRQKWRKKDTGKKNLLQKEDQVHEKQKRRIKVVIQQNVEAEARKDTPQLYIVGKDGEQNEGDQIEISTPERSPVFDTSTLEGSSHLPLCCTENPSQGMHLTRRHPKVIISAAEGLSGNKEQIHVINVYDKQSHREEQMILSKQGMPETSGHKTLQDMQPMAKTNEIDLQLIKDGQDPAMPSQKGSLELCGQKKLPESKLTRSTAALSESGPVNSAGGMQVSGCTFKYQKRPPNVHSAKENDASCRIQEEKGEEELLQEKQLKGQGHMHLDDNSIASFLLQHQLQKLLNTNKQQKKKLEAVNRPKHQGFPIPAVKPSCEGQQYPLEITEVLDTGCCASSILQHQMEKHQMSDTNELLQEVKSGTANGSKQQELVIPVAKPSCEEHHQSEALNGVPEEPAIYSKMPISSKLPNGDDALKFSLLPSSFELETMDIDESLATSHHIQRKRNCQMSNVKRPQLGHQTSVDSSQVKGKQVKLYGAEKGNAGELSFVLALPVASELAGSQESSRLAKLRMHPEIKRQSQKLVSQENLSSCRVLRPRPQPLKSEKSKALIAAADFSPSLHQHDVQKQMKYNLRARPPKANHDKVVSFSKPRLKQQPQNPKCKHLGRPPKPVEG